MSIRGVGGRTRFIKKEGTKKQGNNFKNFDKEKRNKKPPPGSHQIPDKFLIERAKEVMKLKLDGWSYEDIQIYLKDNYNCSISTADSIILSMYDEIKKIAGEDIENLIIDHYYKYEDLYKKASNINNAKLQVKVLEAKEKLLGLIQDQPNIQINNFIKLNDNKEEDTKKILNNLPPDKLNKLTYLFNKALQKNTIIHIKPK